jgi:hypothetical protein
MVNDSVRTPNATDDTLTHQWDYNPANYPGNPYERFPERASWEIGAVFQRPDGTLYQKTQQLHRWAGSMAYGDVVTKERV